MNNDGRSGIYGCGFFLLLIFGLILWSYISTPRPQYRDITPSETINRIQNDEPVYYGDDECTEDCSGHEAGYNWAMDNDICDPDDCGGNSQSFIEGCENYAEECSGGYDEDPDEDYYDY